MPSGSTGGTAFTTQPVVTVQDAGGNTVTGNTSSVTLAITTPAGAALGCTSNPLAAVAGVASFAGCKIDKAGTYTLTATGSVTSAVSGSFTISVGAASKLAFTTMPSGSTGGTAFTSQPVVTVQDAGGNTVTGNASSVTLAITTPGGATLACTTNPLAAISGVASFAGCKIDKAGTYTLTATGSVTSAVSGSFVISAAAANKLAYVQGPTDGTAGTAISPAISVQVQDLYGNAVAAVGVSVTLGLSAGAINSGASATTDSAGRATFSAVTINTAAVGLTLTASAAGLSPTAASAPFNITVAVINGATLTDTASDGAGSGVKTVAYYYCAGYSGPCTAATGTLIGTSTSATGNYLVTWSNSQLSNGPYRLVVVGTDNVTNTSQASASIPVTVTN
jgi:hypothetical protein